MLNLLFGFILFLWAVACFLYPELRKNGLEPNEFWDEVFGVVGNKKK